MRIFTRALLALLVLVPALSACDPLPAKAPRSGQIITITPGSAACHDEQTDVGARRSVSVKYLPDGTDKSKKPWPETFACVTPEQAEKYVIGGRYP